MKALKKITLFADRVFHRVEKKLCQHFGHRWLYKDYSNYIRADGSKYAFKASRNCMRCNQHAYYYSTEWIMEKKSEIDFEGNYFSSPEIKIDKVMYS
jgi:hypothetical protein